MSVQLAPIPSESLVDRVHGSLRRLILNGELGAGSELRQDTLAAQLGISRTPLREALNRLASEGLIELRPHRSAVVSAFTQQDVEEDYEARRVLEPAAARLAAERGDPRTARELERAIRAQRRARGDVEREFAANRAFHVALVAGARNPHLTRFVESLWGGRIAPVFYARQARQPGRRERDLAEHETIARLVVNGDGEGAARAVDEHLLGALEGLRAEAGS